MADGKFRIDIFTSEYSFMIHSTKQRLFKYICPYNVASPFGPMKGYTEEHWLLRKGGTLNSCPSLCA